MCYLFLPPVFIPQPPDRTAGNLTRTLPFLLLLRLHLGLQAQVQGGSPARSPAGRPPPIPNTGYAVRRHTQVPTLLLGGLHFLQLIEYIQ